MLMPIRQIRATSLVIVLLMFPGSLLAGQIIMNNGDVMTGDISKIKNKEVFIDPAYADEFGVKISELTLITSETLFEIETIDGRKLQARFVGEPGNQRIILSDGAVASYGINDIAEATKPEDWYERKSHIDVNGNYNSGNTNTNDVMIYADTRLKTGEHRHFATLRFERSEAEGFTTKDRDALTYEYNWIFNEPWYLAGFLGFEQDPIRELEYRYLLAGLLGVDLWDTSKAFLTIAAGPGYGDEELGDEKENGPSAVWRLDFTYEFLDGKLDFFHNHSYIAQFYGDENNIFKSNTGFRYAITDDIYWNLAYRYDYETEPAAGNSNRDTATVVGLGVVF